MRATFKKGRYNKKSKRERRKKKEIRKRNKWNKEVCISWSIVSVMPKQGREIVPEQDAKGPTHRHKEILLLQLLLRLALCLSFCLFTKRRTAAIGEAAAAQKLRAKEGVCDEKGLSFVSFLSWFLFFLLYCWVEKRVARPTSRFETWRRIQHVRQPLPNGHWIFIRPLCLCVSIYRWHIAQCVGMQMQRFVRTAIRENEIKYWTG